jgi:hypothetical protein
MFTDAKREKGGRMPGDYVQCNKCKGLAVRSPDQQGHPYGWFSVSINVPKGKNGKGYEWVGVYCSYDCLAGDLQRIEKAEENHPDYDAPHFLDVEVKHENLNR